VAHRYEAVVSSLSEHFLVAYKPNSKLLDIGCGSGRDLAVLHKLGHQCYGIDPTPEFVEIAQRVHPELSNRIAHGGLPDMTHPFGGELDVQIGTASDMVKARFKK
jgi:SAM-dependent methyltransferase